MTAAPQLDVKWGHHGFGVFQRKTFFLVSCGDCGRKNHSEAVRTGKCRWCGCDPADRLRDKARPSDRDRPLVL